MCKIKILSDMAGAYGYPVGTILSVEELFKDFRESGDCDDSLYGYLCGIPIPCAVDTIAEEWGLEYKFV